VLLRWSDVTGSLPVATYELRKGATWATADSIGTKTGNFTTIFETAAGTYTYWIAAIDVAGNIGTPKSVTASVNQPPDYVLKSDIDSSFGGTLSSAILRDGKVLLLVEVSETFAQHFTTHSWASPQAQIDAGYPLYLQPGAASAYYEEVFDYGALLAANRITVTPESAVLVGSATVTVDISVSADGSSYTTYSGTTQVYATSFRYVKVRVAASTAGSAIVELSALSVKLDSKLKTITGMATCNSADSGGTTIYLTDDRTSTGNKEFIDVDAIQITPAGTTPLIAIYDFTDSANPLSMKALLYTTAGARASGTISYTVRGF
jgi:hypothetical protein